MGRIASVTAPPPARRITPTLLLGLLAVGLALHGAGSMMNLAQVWSRVGRIGRTAWFLLLAGIVLRFQVVEIQPFDYFRF